MKSFRFSLANQKMNRRKFISACGACSACIAAFPYEEIGTFGKINKNKGKRIRIVFSLHADQQSQPDWPNIGFDFTPFMNRLQDELRTQLPGFDFISTKAKGPEEAAAILEQDKSSPVDGYLVYQLNCWNQVVQKFADTGKPVLYADFQYGGSGGFLVYNSGFIRNKFKNVGFVASSDIMDLVDAVKCFKKIDGESDAAGFSIAVEAERIRNTPSPGKIHCADDNPGVIPVRECLDRLARSRILAVRDTESKSLPAFMNIPVDQIPFSEVNDAYNRADRNEASRIAAEWIAGADVVEGVDPKTIENSAAMYLGMKTVLKEHGANAITINCLGGFYGGHIHAYPCLGFFALNNEGLIGACECDIESTATMVAMTTLTGGRPGYISDPVIDTAKRQIIYAHCVASNRVFGPAGIKNPYTIMSHSEDRQGASVRSVLPAGYMTTTLKANLDRKEIILHRALAVDNDPDDRACRTKLCAEPLGDIEKLFRYWDQWGWHRVTYYGDLKDPVYELAGALGYKVIEEA